MERGMYCGEFGGRSGLQLRGGGSSGLRPPFKSYVEARWPRLRVIRCESPRLCAESDNNVSVLSTDCRVCISIVIQPVMV